MANTIKVGRTDVSIPGVGFSGRVQKAKNNQLLVSAGLSNQREEVRLHLSDETLNKSVAGKPYPGFRMDFLTAREVGRASAIINAIVKLRIQQVGMLPIKIVPQKKEPTRQVSILKYTVHDLDSHPAFDDSDRTFLRDVYERLDPPGITSDKRDVFKEKKDTDFTPGDVATIDYLQNKHDDFYKKRTKDIEEIEKLLKTPDERNTMTKTWNSLIAKIGEDLILLDRAVMIKVRDTSGKIRHIMPIDGATLRPVVNEWGYDAEYPYVQISPTGQQLYLKGDDVIVMMMNPVTDNRFFGYGISPLETLYTVALSDLFIDKGNLDYYKKGGSIPEGFISVEPPATKEGQVNIINQEQLDSIQRQMQAIIMGDYTQIPIVSGGKFTWTDFKGKRKDMQFRELADYVMRKICMVLQVSPQDIGMLDGIKSSDGAVQAELTKSKGLMTIMSAISEYITVEVIREFRPEGDLKLWYEEPEEKEADKNWGTQAKLQAGYISINEARQLEGLPPVPWGDTPLQGNSKNWQPMNPNDPGLMGGMGGPPGAGGLPPIPGLPQPPGGGPTPPPPGGAGGPPPPLELKSYIPYKNYNETMFEQWTMDDTLDVSPLVDMYLKSSRFSEDNVLDEIRTYVPSVNPGKEFSSLAANFGVLADVVKSVDKDDVVLFSSPTGNGVVQVGSGNEYFLSALATEILNTNPRISENIRKAYGSNSHEAVEYALLSMVESPKTREKLHEHLYRYKNRNLTDYDIEEARRIINE